MAGTKIPLSKSKFALVDQRDVNNLLAMGKWTLHSEGYAYRWDRSSKPNKCLLMHRVIMDTPKGMDTDHINGNKLDNRRHNLRIVSRSANSLNRKTMGIEESRHWSGYIVRIIADGTRVYVGRFKNKEEAMHISKDVKNQLLEAIL